MLETVSDGRRRLTLSFVSLQLPPSPIRYTQTFLTHRPTPSPPFSYHSLRSGFRSRNSRVFPTASFLPQPLSVPAVGFSHRICVSHRSCYFYRHSIRFAVITS